MIAVISDVHGCVNTLKSLVKKVEKKYPKIPLYCVGDLVDRGNFGFETVEYVISKDKICTGKSRINVLSLYEKSF